MVHPIVLSHGRMRQGHCNECKASLGYMVIFGLTLSASGILSQNKKKNRRERIFIVFFLVSEESDSSCFSHYLQLSKLRVTDRLKPEGRGVPQGWNAERAILRP